MQRTSYIHIFHLKVPYIYIYIYKYVYVYVYVYVYDNNNNDNNNHKNNSFVFWFFLYLILLSFLLLFVYFRKECQSMHTAQKIKFSVKAFFSKCDQICRKLRNCSHLLKKSLMKNFIFCAVACIIISLLKGAVTVKFEKFNLAF